MYNLWSGINLLEIVLNEKGKTSKRSDFELGNNSQTSDMDSNTFAGAVRKTKNPNVNFFYFSK